MLTVTTFGDSILDCAHYNAHRVDPAGLLVANRDDLFPEFRGRDLSTRLGDVRLDRRAVDGSTVDDLPRQARGLRVEGPALALLTIGGNDLLSGLVDDTGPGVEAFVRELTAFLDALPIRPVALGTVYDPTFGIDEAAAGAFRDPRRARANFDRVNAALVELAPLYGVLADIHAHFLTGRPDWFVNAIEPSLRGASEVRRCFLDAVERAGVLSH
ncbi:MAG TPA: SGNH/GDSL hydrolase family protein [Isosphaeraceae bacterium]|nr:SGNH/GDSL hydrolase family protein [Isosphaeraceae bacterium]